MADYRAQSDLDRLWFNDAITTSCAVAWFRSISAEAGRRGHLKTGIRWPMASRSGDSALR